MEKITIRPAEKKDIPEINALTKEMHRCLGKQVGLSFSDRELDEERVSAAELKGIIVAEDKGTGRIVGYVSFSPKPLHDEWYGKHIYVYEIAVKAGFRGKGIGKRLMERLISISDKRKLNLKIDTLVKNNGTIEFYKEMGFKPFMLYFVREHRKRLKLG